jgi:hypothetical protein
MSCGEPRKHAPAAEPHEPPGDLLAEREAALTALVDWAICDAEAHELFFAHIAQIAERDAEQSCAAPWGIPAAPAELIAALDGRVRALCAAFVANFGEGWLVLPPEFRARAIAATCESSDRRLAELAGRASWIGGSA